MSRHPTTRMGNSEVSYLGYKILLIFINMIIEIACRIQISACAQWLNARSSREGDSTLGQIRSGQSHQNDPLRDSSSSKSAEISALYITYYVGISLIIVSKISNFNHCLLT